VAIDVCASVPPARKEAIARSFNFFIFSGLKVV
jgi:uncharacterized protein YejL (UPF0352 family)